MNDRKFASLERCLRKLAENKSDHKMEDQIFSDVNGNYLVRDLVNFAVRTKKVQRVAIDQLLHNLEASPDETGDELPGHPEFVERARHASLKYPIIIVKYDDGLWVADGVHRLWKANNNGDETIKAYIIDEKELVKFKE
jgi:hypothetical protein